MTRLAFVAALLVAIPLPAMAQERSIGIAYTPSLSLHDAESVIACYSAAGAWLTIGRLHVEHVTAWNSRCHDYPDDNRDTGKVDGHALTALWTVRSWRSQRFRTRFQIGGRHGAATEPTSRAWGAGAGLDVRYGVGPIDLRGAVHLLLPKPPEVRIGVGFRF